MRKGIVVGTLAILGMMVLSAFPLNAMATDDYYIDGHVYFIDGQQDPVSDYEVRLTYAPTREYLTTVTDEDGYYSFNLADLTMGYDDGEWVEITVEPYSYLGGQIPASEGMIKVDTGSSITPEYDLVFDAQHLQIAFLYDVSLGLSNRVPNGFAVWLWWNPCSYSCNVNPINLICGCSITDVNNNALLDIFVDTTWTFHVQNECTDITLTELNKGDYMVARTMGGAPVQFSTSFQLTIATAFPNPYPWEQLWPIPGSTTLTATVSGTWQLSRLGQLQNIGPFTMNGVIILHPPWPPGMPGGISPPSYPPWDP